MVEDSFKGLSQRELQCLFHLVRSRNSKLIGSLLGISPRTVKIHIRNIKKKLGCVTTNQLIEQAFSKGFISVIPQDFIMQDPIILDGD